MNPQPPLNPSCISARIALSSNFQRKHTHPSTQLPRVAALSAIASPEESVTRSRSMVRSLLPILTPSRSRPAPSMFETNERKLPKPLLSKHFHSTSPAHLSAPRPRTEAHRPDAPSATPPEPNKANRHSGSPPRLTPRHQTKPIANLTECKDSRLPDRTKPIANLAVDSPDDRRARSAASGPPLTQDGCPAGSPTLSCRESSDTLKHPVEPSPPQTPES